MKVFQFLTDAGIASWELLVQSAPYVLFGLLVGGLLKIFLSADYVARHLGKGRFSSVLKASILGIPIPLCSCGVLPAAASLRKQGANKGATAAFLVSTPESGVDSISITYALLDPIMTIARPVAAFLSAMVAGIGINLLQAPSPEKEQGSAISLATVSTCSGECGDGCTDDPLPMASGLLQKLKQGVRFAVTDIWEDLAGWFFLGLIAAGLITVLIPNEAIAAYLSGGLSSMLLMLCLGIPLYICATASTPIAAAFILKGVSPGTALVFLLVGPATNVTSLSVLYGLLGKKATVIYLVAIAGVSVLCGLAVDYIYLFLGVSAMAVVKTGAEILPESVSLVAALLLLLFSIKPLASVLKAKLFKNEESFDCCSH